MKLITILSTAMILSGPMSGYAGEQGLLDCVVPSETQTPVTLSITLTKETAADYVMMTLTDATGSVVLFSQADAGSVEKDLAAGGLSLMVLGENFGQENGVIKDAGILSLSTGSGALEGVLVVKGNIYPLMCQAK